MPTPLQPFHLAIPVDDLPKAHEFYHGLLGCPLGRQSDHWIDFNFYGHQLVTHLVVKETKDDQISSKKRISGSAITHEATNMVDKDAVPVRHFGLVLEWNDWEALGARLKGHQWPFLIAPRVRFEGEAGEQGTFFVKDPAGNALEFKSFRNMSQLFAR